MPLEKDRGLARGPVHHVKLTKSFYAIASVSNAVKRDRRRLSRPIRFQRSVRTLVASVQCAQTISLNC
jgi:hypothetical protein